jgi:hypothetical protein
MYQEDTEILFPMRVVPKLRDLRGSEWSELVDLVCSGSEESPSCLAFHLLVIRLASCLSCHTYSYRAMRGCTTCAIHAIKRFDGSDRELLSQYQQSLDEIHAHFEPA